jgi:hypothetical protein
MANIRIGDVRGSKLVGIGISGSGNVVGEKVHVSGTLQVNAGQLEKAPEPLADGIRAFSDAIAPSIEAAQPPVEDVQLLQEGIDELTTEAAEIQPEEEIPFKRKRNIGTALRSVALGLARVLPDAARTVAAMTPLAPFANLIGEGLESIVAEVRGSRP